jgi:Raf kinase inhibitor-like YbhB/YbcL family protein
VKMQLTTSSGPIALRPMISTISASVAVRIASGSLRSTVVAPRRAKRRIGAMMPPMARASRWSFVLLVTVALAGCGSTARVASAPAAPRTGLTVTSPAFSEDGTIPVRYTCSGAGDRPALRFGGVPSAARELALLVIDPDAGGFVHWTVYGMDRSVRGIAATGLPAGARQGRNSTGGTGWTPPCPPSGVHRYEFTLYWLRAPSGLAAGADPQKVVDAIRSAAAGRGELVGRYGKS